MVELRQHLAEIPIFAKMSAGEIDRLIKYAAYREYDRGEFICSEGEAWPKVILIAFGRIEWSMLSADGKRQVIFDLGAGSTAWGHTLFDEKPMPASLEVMERSGIYQWNSETIIPLLFENPHAMWAVTQMLITIMRRVRNIVYGFAFHPVSGRLAGFLLQHYQPANGQIVARDLTLDEMAAFVGTTRELISKILYYYAEQEAIKVSRNEIVFLNIGKLRDMADPD
ncbi:MAG: Crp/Fnr family transcriptional regulator [Bacillota bacterium]